VHATPSNFFRRILRSEALVYKLIIFFSEQPFYGNYSTLDSHANTVISHALANSSRWLPKQWQGLFRHLGLDRLKFLLEILRSPLQIIVSRKCSLCLPFVRKRKNNSLIRPNVRLTNAGTRSAIRSIRSSVCPVSSGPISKHKLKLTELTANTKTSTIFRWRLPFRRKDRP